MPGKSRFRTAMLITSLVTILFSTARTRIESDLSWMDYSDLQYSRRNVFPFYISVIDVFDAAYTVFSLVTSC